MQRNLHAFAILMQIGIRCKFKSEPNSSGLKQGQAFIGDYLQFGMTRSEYRTACKHLADAKLASFVGVKGGALGQSGTIATLLDNRVFEIYDSPNSHRFSEVKTEIIAIENQTVATPSPENSHRSSHRFSEVNSKTLAIAQTISSPAHDQELATKKNGKNGNNEKNNTSLSHLGVFVPIILSKEETQSFCKEHQLTVTGVQRGLEDFNARSRKYHHADGNMKLADFRIWLRGEEGQESVNGFTIMEEVDLDGDIPF